MSIEREAPTMYRLRHETRDGGLATIEAIARALGVLEGGHVRSALEKVFRAMVERTLWSRGSSAPPKCPPKSPRASCATTHAAACPRLSSFRLPSPASARVAVPRRSDQSLRGSSHHNSVPLSQALFRQQPILVICEVHPGQNSLDAELSVIVAPDAEPDGDRFVPLPGKRCDDPNVDRTGRSRDGGAWHLRCRPRRDPVRRATAALQPLRR